MTAKEIFEELDIFDTYSYEYDDILELKKRVDDYWKAASIEDKRSLRKDGRLEQLVMVSRAIEDIKASKKK